MLHTPTAQEPGITTERLVTKDGQPAKIGERAYDKETGRLAQVGLSQQVMMLKTPCAADSYTDNMTSKGISGTSGTLAQEVVSGYATKHRGLLLPTPLSVEREHPERVEALKATGATRINSRANGEQRPNGLIDFMQFYDMLPTPTTDIFKIAGMSESAWEKRIADGRQEDVVMAVYKEYKKADMLDAVIDGKAFRLSPLFTEEMMGFPLMWTTLPFLPPNGAPKPSKPTATP